MEGIEIVFNIIVLLVFFAILGLFIQSLIDRSFRIFKETEYNLKIKELENKIAKLEKINKERD